jgi:hypothetical protein
LVTLGSLVLEIFLLLLSGSDSAQIQKETAVTQPVFNFLPSFRHYSATIFTAYNLYYLRKGKLLTINWNLVVNSIYRVM